MSVQAVSPRPSFCQGISQKFCDIRASCKKIALIALNVFYCIKDFLTLPFYGWNRVFRHACTYDHRFTVALFLKKVDINAKDFHGNTPLSLASAHQNEKIVRFLVENGADQEQAFKKTFPYNCLPLVKYMDPKVLQNMDRQLIKNSDKTTSLMGELAYDFNPELIEALVDQGFSFTPLFEALLTQAYLSMSKVARGLVQTGFYTDRAAQELASISHLVTIFERSISIYERKTDSNINTLRLEEGDTLLLGAVESRCPEIVESLLSRENIDLHTSGNVLWEEASDYPEILTLLNAKREQNPLPSVCQKNEEMLSRIEIKP